MSSTRTGTTPAVKAYYDSTVHWGSPRRNFRCSARLRMQHGLFLRAIGGKVLHPDIEAAILAKKLPAAGGGGSMLRVADIGAANAVWLVDLHEHLTTGLGLDAKTGFQLDGYDIQTGHFPPQSTLPDTIRMIRADFFEEPGSGGTSSLEQGVYDVVHLRLWSSMVRRNDPSPTIRAAMRLLKPGGYIQWEEMTIHRMAATPTAAADAAKPATEKLLGLMRDLMAVTGDEYDFMEVLGEHLSAGGFEDVTFQQHATRPVDYKGWTEDYLLVWEELADAMAPAAKAPPGMALTREAFWELFPEIVAEAERGIAIHHEFIVVATGRKPL